MSGVRSWMLLLPCGGVREREPWFGFFATLQIGLPFARVFAAGFCCVSGSGHEGRKIDGVDVGPEQVVGDAVKPLGRVQVFGGHAL